MKNLFTKILSIIFILFTVSNIIDAYSKGGLRSAAQEESRTKIILMKSLAEKSPTREAARKSYRKAREQLKFAEQANRAKKRFSEKRKAKRQLAIEQLRQQEKKYKAKEQFLKTLQ